MEAPLPAFRVLAFAKGTRRRQTWNHTLRAELFVGLRRRDP